MTITVQWLLAGKDGQPLLRVRLVATAEGKAGLEVAVPIVPSRLPCIGQWHRGEMLVGESRPM